MLGRRTLGGPRPFTEKTMKLRAAAMAACLVGTGTAARAYDYVDSRGYRHWCQLSCERKGIHVPKSGEVKSDEVKSGEVKSDEVKSGEVKPRQRKVIDENDLAWEPPRGVKWQVVPETPSRADTKLFKPGEIAKQDKRP
jgi:hypothetical protein